MATALFAPVLRAADQPNIFFLLADDLGWADIGCDGSTFDETPNIGRLAKRGNAANVLDRLGERARPSLPAMKRAVESAPTTPGGTYPPQHILSHTIAVLEGRTPAFVYPQFAKSSQP